MMACATAGNPMTDTRPLVRTPEWKRRQRLIVWLKKYGFSKESDYAEMLSAVLKWADNERKRDGASVDK